MRDGWDDKDTAIVTLGAIVVAAIVASVITGQSGIAEKAIMVCGGSIGGIATGKLRNAK